MIYFNSGVDSFQCSVCMMCICIQKRETKIEQITKETLDRIDDDILHVENHPILYLVDKDAVSKVRLCFSIFSVY